MPTPGFKQVAYGLGGLAAVGIFAGAGISDVDAANASFDVTSTYLGPSGSLHSWRLHIHNSTPGSSGLDSATDFEAYTGDVSDESYAGGTIGHRWATSSINSESFSAFSGFGLGYIDPTGLDPSADDLFINYLSPHATLVGSTVVIHTNGGETITVNVQLPGDIGDPAWSHSVLEQSVSDHDPLRPGDETKYVIRFTNDSQVSQHDMASFVLNAGLDRAVYQASSTAGYVSVNASDMTVNSGLPAAGGSFDLTFYATRNSSTTGSANATAVNSDSFNTLSVPVPTSGPVIPQDQTSWSITTLKNHSVEDDRRREGREWYTKLQINNLSQVSAHDIASAVLSNGSTAAIYKHTGPISINSNSISLSGVPDNQDSVIVELYATVSGSSTGTANATADNSDPFPQLAVTLPRPGTLIAPCPDEYSVAVVASSDPNFIALSLDLEGCPRVETISRIELPFGTNHGVEGIGGSPGYWAPVYDPNGIAIYRRRELAPGNYPIRINTTHARLGKPGVMTVKSTGGRTDRFVIPTPGLLADLNEDGKVDFGDYAIAAMDLGLATDSDIGSGHAHDNGVPRRDDVVDRHDIQIIGAQWLLKEPWFGRYHPRHDLNHDGSLNEIDLEIIQNNIGKDTATGDINNDGVVDPNDADEFRDRWLAPAE